MCLLLLWKSERRKNNCYLVFADKNDVFLFFKKDKYLTGLAFAQEAHASLKEPQNNRNYSRSENFFFKAVLIKLKQCMEPCVSCFYLTYWNTCENLHYESRIYFKSYTTTKKTIDRQYTERRQL